MATQQRGKKTREDILNTAMHLFSLHGYHQTSTNDILEAAAISKGAFYYHFKSKEDLALKVLDKFQNDMQENVFTPLLASERPESLFDSLITPPNGLGHSNADLHRQLLTRFRLEMSHEVNELARRICETTMWLTEQITKIVGQLSKSKSLPSSLTPQTLAEIITAIWFGTACQNNDSSKDALNGLKQLIIK